MEHDITLGTILEHLRAFEGRMLGQFTGLEGRMDTLEQRIDRMDRNLTRQIDAIDKRLDAVEIEQLPKRVTRVERHLNLAPIA